MKKIIIDKQTCAYIVHDIENNISRGIEFYTQENFSLQVGGMSHDVNHKIKAHRHLPQKRIIFDTQEIIYILKGSMKVSFYDKNNIKVVEETLKTGDLIHLISGAHSFEITEECKFFEIKQGPYVMEKDKTIL